jgi:hypothetical protein
MELSSGILFSYFQNFKKNPLAVTRGFFGAEDRARTGHPDLGKVVLYQMSYFRKLCPDLSSGI